MVVTADPSLPLRGWDFERSSTRPAWGAQPLSGVAVLVKPSSLFYRGVKKVGNNGIRLNIHDFLRYPVSHLLRWRDEAEGLNELRNLGPDGQTLV